MELIINYHRFLDRIERKRTLSSTQKEELLEMTEDVLWYLESNLSFFELRVKQSGIRTLFSYDLLEQSTQSEAFEEYIKAATPKLEDYYKALTMYDRFNAIPIDEEDEENKKV